MPVTTTYQPPRIPGRSPGALGSALGPHPSFGKPPAPDPFNYPVTDPWAVNAVNSAQNTPASAPATTPPPPPAAPPPPAPAPPPTTAPNGQAIDYSGDPILARVKAFNQASIQSAQAAALAGKKTDLIGYGYDPAAAALYPDQNTVDAATQNPFSTLKNLDLTHTQRGRGIDEGTNNANLFYSGEHVRELGQEGRQYLGERASASDALQRALGGLDQGVLDAKSAADLREIDAEQSAYERALQFALDHPTTPTDPTTPPPGTPPAGPGNTPGPTGGSPSGSGPSGTGPLPAGIPGVPTGTSPPIVGGTTPPVGYHQAGAAGGQNIYVQDGTPPAVEQALVQYQTDDLLGVRPGATRPGSALPQAPTGSRTTASTTAGAPVDPVAAQATAAGQATFALVRNSSSLPGNAAPAGAAAAAMYNADDPLAAQNLAASGGKAGVWVPTHTNETAQQYAARVIALAGQNPGQIMLDIEGEGKGYPGTAGYQFTQDVYAALNAAGVKVPVSVTVPGGGEDDFNYSPIVQSGGTVWIQCYGADASQVMDPKTRYDMMIARGVPANQIGLMLMPGQQPIPGVPYSYYGIEDFNGKYPTVANPQQTNAMQKPTAGVQAAISNALSSATNYSPATQQAIQQAVIAAFTNPTPTPTLTASRSKPQLF